MCVPVDVRLPAHDDVGKMRWMEDIGVAKKADVDGLIFSRRKEKPDLPVMTMDEVKHAADKEGRVLVVVEGKVLDVAKWAKFHPGGVSPLFHGAGKDMTEQFARFHSMETYKKLGAFHVANVAAKDTMMRNNNALQRDWDQFTQDILEEGVYETDYKYFAWIFIRTMFLLGAVVAVLMEYMGPQTTTTTVVAGVLFGFFLQQMNFLGHDLGHNGVTHSTKWDTVFGVICGNLLSGVSIWWWKDSHNNHHVCCNSIDCDADIQHMPFIVCNSKIMDRPFFSRWHHDWHSATTFAARYLLRYQHIIYYPAIVGFARYNLYIQSWVYVLSGKSRMPKTEVVGLLGFMGMVGGLMALLPDARQRITFLLVSHAIAGILNVQITLSHFCMDVYWGSPYDHTKGIEDQWLWTQLRTTLALTCSPWMDWFHGGLQFQDVHHLLPRVPRHNLRQLRPRIQAICKKHGCDVSPEMTFLEANIQTWKLVREASKKAYALSPQESPTKALENSMLFDTLFARG